MRCSRVSRLNTNGVGSIRAASRGAMNRTSKSPGTSGIQVAEQRGKMSTLVELQASRGVWQLPASKPLDEAVWQAWIKKGRARDRRSNLAHTKALKVISIAALLAAAAAGSD